MLKDIDNDNRKVNWASLVKTLLCNLGFYDDLVNQGVGDTKLFLHILKQRLDYQFFQTWNRELENSSRAVFYRTFADFQFQDYLDIITVRKFRIAMTKLRIASHRLEVETGRWSRPNAMPFEERKCKICNQLEDEFHFLFECLIYSNLRLRYFRNYYLNRPSMFKLVELFKTNSEKQLRDLAMYIFKAFELRHNMVYLENVNI